MSQNNDYADSGRARQPLSKVYNAASIAAHQLLGINRVVNLAIIIEGKVIRHFTHFTLNQSASRHHAFRLVLPHDALDKAENHELESAQQFLGRRLTAIFSYRGVPDSPERAFQGVVMEVGYEQAESSLGSIVITGYSPTVLLDLAPHTQSFGGKQDISLQSIAEQVIREGVSSDKYNVRLDCGYTKNLLYSCQYNETHYNYLCRMAEAYGEQFFYDGEVLHFGKLPPAEKPLALYYGSNVTDIKVRMRAKHVNPSFYGYNSSKHEKLTGSEPKVEHRSDIAKRAYQISKSAITTPSLRAAPIRASTFLDINASQTGAAGSSATQVFITSGTTSLPFLYPGCAVELNMRKPDSSETGYFTELMVTEVAHTVDARGEYSATFEAIGSETGFLPRPDFEPPLAESQVATVISNSDPKNQGRVQVRFDWQLHDTTDWIRVMTPDAGGTDQVTQNRGYVAIPEVGDQVMVGFQHSHPDRPFVMGGMFHGKVALGGGRNNHMRSIQTKSGIKVLMNDDEKSVTILDPSGNTYFMDGAGNITVTAPKNMNFNVGENLNISVGKDMTTNIGNDNTINIINNHVFTSKNYKQTVNEDKTIDIIGNLKETTSTTTHKAKNGDILMQSSGVAKIIGKIDAKVNKG